MKEMNVRYQNQDNYRLPCITTKEQKELHIGMWANRHRQYLKQHHRIKYYNLLTSEKLYPYLADIEEQAEAMFSRLVKSLAEKENVLFGGRLAQYTYFDMDDTVEEALSLADRLL